MDKLNVSEEEIKKTMIVQNAQIKLLLNRIEMVEKQLETVPDISEQVVEYKKLIEMHKQLETDMFYNFFADLLRFTLAIDKKTVLKVILIIFMIVLCISFVLFFISALFRELILYNMKTYSMIQ